MYQNRFVLGLIREKEDLTLIAARGIKVLPLYKILAQLRHELGRLTGGAGTDLAELIEYYNQYV